jgi:hypothetical protein
MLAGMHPILLQFIGLTGVSCLSFLHYKHMLKIYKGGKRRKAQGARRWNLPREGSKAFVLITLEEITLLPKWAL